MGLWNLVPLVNSWLVSTCVVLLWVHRSKQKLVSRSWPHSRMVALRIGLLFGVMSLTFVAGFDLPVVGVSVITAIVVLLLPVTSLGALEAADNAVSAAFLALVISRFSHCDSTSSEVPRLMALFS